MPPCCSSVQLRMRLAGQPEMCVVAPEKTLVDNRKGLIGKDRSGPVSRVLSRAAISLGRRLPAASSDLPGRVCEPDQLATVSRTSPYAVLLPVGFAEQAGHPVCWCALTAPFHPYRETEASRRFTFCCTFPVLADGGRYPPPCPVEPGLSSPKQPRPRRTAAFAAATWPASALFLIVHHPALQKIVADWSNFCS